MSRDEQEEERVRSDTIRAYVASAEDDLLLAELALEAPDYKGWGQIGFHAQQAAEKLIKAMLVSHQIHPDPHHDIAELRGQLRLWDRQLADELRDADSLTPFAVRFRYPPKDIDRPHPVGRARARNAVETARRVRERIRSRLHERGHLAPSTIHPPTTSEVEGTNQRQEPEPPSAE